MSYKDPKLGQIFPTRTGTPSGAANERRMLDALGGSEGFRKSFQTNADGSVTMLTTKNGMPQFSTTTPKATTATCDIGMDNGVVDLLSAGFLMDSNSNKAGKLRRTGYVSAGLAAPPVTDKTPVVDVIKSPNTQGTPPADNADSKAFKENSYGKKRIAVLCPPSIFTGKTRLYVQALYGRHEDIDIQISPTIGMATPYIMVGGVKVHTSCGIWYEASQHFLISVNVGSTLIYPLKPSACAAKLYPKLLDSTISEENKERIESYILGQSVPDSAGVIALTNNVLSVDSMGYGWHFNWSGSACDMVVTNTVAKPGGGVENESYHYRLTFSRNAVTGLWSSNGSVVEGPKRWFNQRNTQVLTYPAWDGSGMRKMGPALGVVTGNAPYYCFYVRDTLKVCRYSASSLVIPKGASRSPAYMHPQLLLTLGADAGYYATWSEYSTTEVTLSCGSSNVTGRSDAHTRQVKSHSAVTPATGFDPVAQSWYFPGTMAGWAPNAQLYISDTYTPTQISTISDYYEGDIQVCSAVENQTPATPPSQWYAVPENVVILGPVGPEQCTWSYSNYSAAIGSSTVFISVIPFNDAEAVYLMKSHTTTESQTGSDTVVASAAGFFKSIGLGGMNGPCYAYLGHTPQLNNAFTGTGTTTTRDNPVAPVTTTESVGVSGYGTLSEITIPTPAAFFNPTYDVVPVMVYTVTAASRKATYSAEAQVDEGNAPASVAGRPIVYVGWA